MERRLNFKTYWTLAEAFGDAAKYKPGSWAGSWCCCIFAMSRTFQQIQHRWSTIPFLVVVMTCAWCKRCPGLMRMAGFRKFQQTSYITHEVSIAVEVCTHLPCLFTQTSCWCWLARPKVLNCMRVAWSKKQLHNWTLRVPAHSCPGVDYGGSVTALPYRSLPWL